MAGEPDSSSGNPLAKSAERGLESPFLYWATLLAPGSGLESELDSESESDPKSTGLEIGLVRFGHALCSSY